MPIKATELKRGQALMYEGQLHVILDTDHVKPGKGPAYVQAKMKNLETGTIKVNRLNSSDRLDDVSIDRRKMAYLYDSSGHGEGPFVFMDTESFDQLEIDTDILVLEQRQWLTENLEVTVMIFEGKPHGFFNYGRDGNKPYYETVTAMDKFLASMKWLSGPPTLAKP